MILLQSLGIFTAYSSMVACRAFQQKNVQGNHYLAVVPTSYLMGGLELIANTVLLGETIINGFTLTAAAFWFAAGTGGAAGCCAAMWFHNRYMRKQS